MGADDDRPDTVKLRPVLAQAALWEQKTKTQPQSQSDTQQTKLASAAAAPAASPPAQLPQQPNYSPSLTGNAPTGPTVTPTRATIPPPRPVMPFPGMQQPLMQINQRGFGTTSNQQQQLQPVFPASQQPPRPKFIPVKVFPTPTNSTSPFPRPVAPQAQSTPPPQAPLDLTRRPKGPSGRRLPSVYGSIPSTAATTNTKLFAPVPLGAQPVTATSTGPVAARPTGPAHLDKPSGAAGFGSSASTSPLATPPSPSPSASPAPSPRPPVSSSIPGARQVFPPVPTQATKPSFAPLPGGGRVNTGVGGGTNTGPSGPGLGLTPVAGNGFSAAPTSLQVVGGAPLPGLATNRTPSAPTLTQPTPPQLSGGKPRPPIPSKPSFSSSGSASAAVPQVDTNLSAATQQPSQSIASFVKRFPVVDGSTPPAPVRPVAVPKPLWPPPSPVPLTSGPAHMPTQPPPSIAHPIVDVAGPPSTRISSQSDPSSPYPPVEILLFELDAALARVAARAGVPQHEQPLVPDAIPALPPGIVDVAGPPPGWTAWESQLGQPRTQQQESTIAGPEESVLILPADSTASLLPAAADLPGELAQLRNVKHALSERVLELMEEVGRLREALGNGGGAIAAPAPAPAPMGTPMDSSPLLRALAARTAALHAATMRASAAETRLAQLSGALDDAFGLLKSASEGRDRDRKGGGWEVVEGLRKKVGTVQGSGAGGK
ncbi:hypothetical protein M427DRAFT_367104 [Gonapodya prolifera JEL478]|uniref:Uncharacterized protein n=1 Tax=Gonapodya prolifera (strain JEL478) TaxID=1344416 RepID=A0A139A9U6_GONPJ|nr:hypothetical protein M427DRAFT_367104 [Gonapodya prolifera JEL478]|eukprot:KXS13449.1 hypothetical protein M427DRAFT_367104 [Gonapodya prolifera JEL478]